MPQGHIYGAKWLGVPALLLRARVVRVIVGDSTDEKYWAREFVGQERLAVQMNMMTRDGWEQFYLDAEEGDTVNRLVTEQWLSEDPKYKHSGLTGFRQVMIQRVSDNTEGIQRAYGKLVPAVPRRERREAERVAAKQAKRMARQLKQQPLSASPDA
jgi:hypothetical protein